MERFAASTVLAQRAEEVFAWHARPGAFERLAPPWQHVRVIERSGAGVDIGTRLTIELALGRLRRRWVAVHDACEPGRSFRDRQESGPFAHWVHTHRFVDDGAGSRLEDDIEYALPLGGLGAALAGGSVRRSLARLFAFRHARTRIDLERHGRFADRPRLAVLIGGGSGLVGSALGAFLTAGGHAVRTLTRGGGSRDGAVRYDPARGTIDAGALDGIDAVVHLAGAGIADGRWTAARKDSILQSRVDSTSLVARTIAGLPRPPRVMVTASAIGFYGDRGDEPLDERSHAGTGFLADVCRAWEEATRPAEEAGIRVVHLRIGIVLAAAGGALPKMVVPFRLGLGGPLGSGRQFMSWIALDDVVGAIHHALFDDTLQGPVNATAPAPVTNAEFTARLARVVRRPALLPAPEFAIRALTGEMGDALLIGGARVAPAALERAGFAFAHADLEGALRAELGMYGS